MHLLTRTVRLCMLPPGAPAGTKNTYAGTPSLTAMGAFYAFDISVRGSPDAQTGYLRDIKVIDRAAHAVLLPGVQVAYADATTTPALTLAKLLAPLDAALGGGLSRVRWHLSPFFSMEMHMDQTSHVTLREKFDFAAAHRLHVPSRSDAENREMFGKCNNPHGHGHNYQFEPAVRVAAGTSANAVAMIESLAQSVILDRFDHKHLNEDTPEFDPRRGGVNPSVENIAKVFFELLEPHVANAGAQLLHITVWETDRTSATYPG
jgi:6-pyruvoyltetrahydropterin/6-carboxytetrahydropterin synthase